MPLNTIRAELAADEGIKISSTPEKAWLDDKINKAAQELYAQNDLDNCLREQIFRFGIADQQISLPFYVDDVRMVRNYEFTLPVLQKDMRPRYHVQGWLPPYREWRIKYKDAALASNITNVGPLTITLPQACTLAFTITIVGRTGSAQRRVEHVTFAVGDTEKVTTENYEEVESITKNVSNNEDLVVTDMGGTQLAAIPNSELKSSYTIIQVLDRYQNLAQTPLYEILYKLKLSPMVTDTDSFPCGDKYDRAIYWKAMELIYAKQQGEVAVQKVIGASAKCAQVLSGLEDNADVGVDQRISFAPCPYYNLFDGYFPYGGQTRFTP